MNRLILASGSPRRKQLLSEICNSFEIITADIDETTDSDKNIKDEIERLSFSKAYEVFKDNKDAVVIGSDTIVTLNGKALGKPKNKEDAFKMLKMLQNNTHQVITAVTILSSEKSETFSVVSDVTFFPMTDEEISAYIDTKEPLDKAGAYAIQGLGGKYIRNINGDYYAIIGLPIGEVYHRLSSY